MKRMIGMALVAALGCSGAALAQELDAPGSAQATDPADLGWMQGFPAPVDKVIRLSDPDYFAFPKLRWSVCNFRQLMPTVAVDNGIDGVRVLPEAIKPALGGVTFTPLGGGDVMTWDAAFDANYTDGVIVLHHGRVVYERYDGCLSKNTLHGAMAVTQSLTGLLAEMLVAEGTLDDTARVVDLIPELESSGFGDATVRQVMDMTTALDYSEEYSDPDADVWTYAEAGSPLPKPEGYEGPRSYFEFLQTVQKNGEHGEAFGDRMINADTLGWLIARASGTSVSDLLSDRIWSRLGTQREAFYTLDSIGTPFAGGGFSATLRDMARLGQMMLEGGRAGGEQIVPEGVVTAIAQDRKSVV